MVSKKIKGKIHTFNEIPFGKHLRIFQIAYAKYDLALPLGYKQKVSFHVYCMPRAGCR